MNFIGRNKDLEKITNRLNEDNFNLTLVYGRRRVGKSELVKQAIKACDFKSIYYECKQVSELNNVESLAKNVSTSLNMPPLGYKDIESLLRYLFEYAKNEKLILVLDEYPYFKNAIEGIDSVLQSLIDEYREESKLSLIILGSYVDVMKSLLEHSNPLYGRVDLCINLTPMDYYESSLFYPNFSNEDKVRIYSAFGGIPYYNRLIDDRKSVKENIINLIASEDARLENEVSMYLNSEISKIINANEVFEALAKGYSKYKDILSQSHVSSGPTLVDVLDKLMRMEIVEKVTPINEPSNKKKTYYKVKDNLSLFYYRYIFPHSSELKIMNANAFFDKYIKKDFDEYFVPHQFETICAQYIIRLNRNNFIKV